MLPLFALGGPAPTRPVPVTVPSYHGLYVADGRVREQTLTEGAKYTFGYTKAGSGAGRVTAASVTEPGGAVRRVEFDADGYGTSDTQAHRSSLARRTVYQRGSYHRIDAVTDPYGRRTELSYDANGYVTSAKERAGTPQARSSGTAVYDGPFDQPTLVTDPLGNITRLAYGADGDDLETVTDSENRETVTDVPGAVTEYTYEHGELTAVKDAEGRTSSQFLDAVGRPVVMTDEAGARTTVTYDALNQARKVTDPLGQSTVLDYDDNGNLTTLTDARNNTTTWAYDTADRPKPATDPLGAQALFEYDAAGRVSKVTSRTGQMATAEYDLLGRPGNAKYGVDLPVRPSPRRRTPMTPSTCPGRSQARQARLVTTTTRRTVVRK